MIMLLWDGYGLGFQESMIWEEVQRMATFIGMTKRVLSVGELDKKLVGLQQSRYPQGILLFLLCDS